MKDTHRIHLAPSSSLPPLLYPHVFNLSDMADQILGFAVRGIASGVGLASEGVSNFKQKKRAQKVGNTVVDFDPQTSQTPNERLAEEGEEEDGDEEQWVLDEAQSELIERVPSTGEVGQEKKEKNSARRNQAHGRFCTEIPRRTGIWGGCFATETAVPVDPAAKETKRPLERVHQGVRACVGAMRYRSAQVP